MQNLPTEVLESILLWCATCGHPFSVAAVAQTCRQLRALVYDAKDRHLWRNLYLAVFDDPRRGSTIRNDFDWQGHFTQRFWARSYIQHHARVLQVQKKPHHLRSTRSTSISDFSEDTPGDPQVHTRLLRVLIAVIQTAAPSAHHLHLDAPSDALENTALTELHVQTPLSPPAVESEAQRRSLNILWLGETLSRGLPYSLTKLLLSPAYGSSGTDWRELTEGQALCQLTAYLGFLPVPVEEVEPSPTAKGKGKTRTKTRGEEVTDMSETAQRLRVRNCARALAFNMRYLSRRRNWGPYLAHPPRTKARAEVLVDAMEEGEDDGDSDESDGDYVPPDNASSSSSLSATPEPQEGETRPTPRAEELWPDWTWLGAARVVAGWKARAHIDPADVARLEAWDNLRGGAWVAPPSLGREGSEELQGRGEGADAAVREAEEWRKYERDWAGVEGIWRRLVCWLDYDDLIFHNLYRRFDDEDLHEAWIIVPMSLRITHYSAPALAAAHPDRPTIHVQGDMGGAGWVGGVEAHDDDVRRVHGAVSMLPDGSVRWSLTSTAPNSTEDEWASEAVQLGGVGSSMGSIGMWTGAQHEDGDPLGVFWQWRVR